MFLPSWRFLSSQTRSHGGRKSALSVLRDDAEERSIYSHPERVGADCQSAGGLPGRGGEIEAARDLPRCGGREEAATETSLLSRAIRTRWRRLAGDILRAVPARGEGHRRTDCA